MGEVMGLEVGFTGTQLGMSSAQKDRVRVLLERINPSGVAHGDCIGADAEFHAIALALGKWIRIHPPKNSAKRAHCREWNEMMPTADYLIRNKAIVDSVGALIACPYEEEEQLRSGTWSTVRYARKQGLETIIVIYPDGKEKWE